MGTNTTKPEVKSALIHSKEIVNWVAFRRFCDHLKGMLDAEQKKGHAIVVEVWSFPQSRPPEKKQ